MPKIKTSVRLAADLLGAAKRHAFEHGMMLNVLTVEALEEKLAQRSPSKVRTFRGGGLQSSVNLDSRAELLDLMEGLEPNARR